MAKKRYTTDELKVISDSLNVIRKNRPKKKYGEAGDFTIKDISPFLNATHYIDFSDKTGSFKVYIHY